MTTRTNIKSKLNGNELDLSLMQLHDVPVSDIAALPKATIVDLSSNFLKTLPVTFPNLTQITKLDLSKNMIKDLPHNFGNLINLQWLDLYENQLQILPESFHQLGTLKWLDLKNNPLDPHLKTAAGDCNSDEECKYCAKQVVIFMRNVHEHLEVEREKKQKREKDKAANQKAKEQAALEKLRQEKKAAKEKRKMEFINQQAQKQIDDQQPSTSTAGLQEELTLQSLRSRELTSTLAIENDVKTSKIMWILALAGIFSATMFWFYFHGSLSNLSLQNLTKTIANGTYVGKRMIIQVFDSLQISLNRLTQYMRNSSN